MPVPKPKNSGFIVALIMGAIFSLLLNWLFGDDRDWSGKEEEAVEEVDQGYTKVPDSTFEVVSGDIVLTFTKLKPNDRTLFSGPFGKGNVWSVKSKGGAEWITVESVGTYKVQ